MKYKTVQTMMLPDSTEENHGLYYQGTEGVHVINEEKKSLYIPENEKAELFTYFNGFYPGQWSEYTELNGLHVEVTVSGNCGKIFGRLDSSGRTGARMLSPEYCFWL